MSLLRLDNIGKIYVSEKNVSVGIREVNLSFDLGEFVCVTGKSGSGKSTLLNVISGMDSYEEGELFIEGEPTSHYLQTDWEQYRERYISFVFQDYNIIDSFTVLENVELALMHIEDVAERRKKALELIDRVGLSSHVKQKGSKLSGGQKQRTVIARALAKDSPIILADEPTGNLDATTSKEIIELLRRVSENKLLIVVTHNYDDFAHCATRHIRIHDGSIELDNIIAEKNVIIPPTQQEHRTEENKFKLFKDGFTLGLSVFKAKPRLTAFLCLLMMIGCLGLFMVTSLCGSAADAFKPNYMFNHIDGRLVITTQSGRVITDSELADLAEEFGAKSYIHFDVLLDEAMYGAYAVDGDASYYNELMCCFGEDFGDDIIGEYPDSVNEALLYLPIYMKYDFDDDGPIGEVMKISGVPFTVSGVKYYYDNNLPAKCLLTEEGFRLVTAAHYFAYCDLSISLNIDDGSGYGYVEMIRLSDLLVSFDIDKDKVYPFSSRYDSLVASDSKFVPSVSFYATYYKYNYFGTGDSSVMQFSRDFVVEDIAKEQPQFYRNEGVESALVISDEILLNMAEEVLSGAYKQASLFFENDREAYRVAEALNGREYIAVPSDTTYTPSADEAILTVLASAITALLWFASVVFLAFFVNLCSIRAVDSFRGDIAIMRSMGIQIKVIKFAIYVRMALCLLPAFLLLAVLAIVIFSTKCNEYFTYLYAWQYIAIILGMLILTLRTTKKQIIRLFGDSVKKTIKGGEAE